MLKRVKKFIMANRGEVLLLACILLMAALLRLYRIDEYMTFLGDEGRDAIIVRRLLVDFDLILIGPGTSIGNMYLGPLYYYMMAPALLFANFSPVGPAVMIAVLGVVTVGMVWFVGRMWFGKFAGLIACLLYALSPVIILYNRSSWNPNIMPFFSLLYVYSVWQMWRNQNWKWIPVITVSLSFALQSHYLALLLVPLAAIFWLISLLRIFNDKYNLKKFIKFSLLGVLILVFLMSPLVLFDFRHGWRNAQSMGKFFLERQTTVSARPWNALPEMLPEGSEAFGRLVSGYNLNIGMALFIILSVTTLLLLVIRLKSLGLSKFLGIRKGADSNTHALLILTIWIGSAIGGLALYKQEIYDHYYGFFFTAPFILLGGLLWMLRKKTKILGTLFGLTVTLLLSILMIQSSPLTSSPSRQLQRSSVVAHKILQEANGQKFNLAVIAERNYEGAYQYFLEKDGDGFVGIDPQRAAETVADQLFVVCELTEEKCDPTHNPKAEVANFGWSEIEQTWHLEGVVVYKLVHSQGESR